MFKADPGEGHLNRCIGSKVMAILLNGWILPSGGVASGRVGPALFLNSVISLEVTQCKVLVVIWFVTNVTIWFHCLGPNFLCFENN